MTEKLRWEAGYHGVPAGVFGNGAKDPSGFLHALFRQIV